RRACRLPQPSASARPDAAANLDADNDSPDSVVGAAGVPTIMQTTSYKPWKYMYPRTWRLSIHSDALGMGPSAFVSTTISDPVGNHNISANLLVPVTEGDPSINIHSSATRVFRHF